MHGARDARWCCVLSCPFWAKGGHKSDNKWRPRQKHKCPNSHKKLTERSNSNNKHDKYDALFLPLSTKPTMTLNEDPNSTANSGNSGVASSVSNVAGALSALSSASGSMYVFYQNYLIINIWFAGRFCFCRVWFVESIILLAVASLDVLLPCYSIPHPQCPCWSILHLDLLRLINQTTDNSGSKFKIMTFGNEWMIIACCWGDGIQTVEMVFWAGWCRQKIYVVTSFPLPVRHFFSPHAWSL